MTPVRGIVFDLDGTLVDSLADITHAMNRAFAELSLPPVTEEQVRPALGHGALELVRDSGGRSRPTAPTTPS